MPGLPVRRSVRLRGHDYREAGAYFVTVCTLRRACLFGEIVDDHLQLSPIGEIVAAAWTSTPGHFPGIDLDAVVVMPNHVHGIILIVDSVGAKHASPLRVSPRGTSSGSLAAIVQSFKSAATRSVNLSRKTLGFTLWQRGYYEHVVRDDEELNRIRRYIEDNPLRWALDRENPPRSV